MTKKVLLQRHYTKDLVLWKKNWWLRTIIQYRDLCWGDKDMLTKDQYLTDPCKAASISYWEAKAITVPDSMKILHQDEYDSAEYQN